MRCSFEFLRGSGLPSCAVTLERGFSAGSVEHNPLHHLPHECRCYRCDYPAACDGVKRNLLRRILGFRDAGDNTWFNQQAIVGNARHHTRKLDWSNCNLLSHGNGTDGDLRPPAEWLRQATRFTRKFNSRLLPETKVVNVSVKSVVAQPQR